jgi:hypothetical protein
MQSTRKVLSSQFDQQHIEGLAGSPTAAEARYFRTLEHLKLVEARKAALRESLGFGALGWQGRFCPGYRLILLDNTIELAKLYK